MSIVVFKQWLYSPNKKTTQLRAVGMMNYIATRDGVALNPELPYPLEQRALLSYIEANDTLELDDSINPTLIESLEQLAPEEMMDYMANRPGVVPVSAVNGVQHGLFGQMLGMNEAAAISDLSEAKQKARDMAKEKKTIYNAVISLTEEDAKAKGLVERADWESLVSSHIYNIIREMGLQPRTTEWTAALHYKAGHPHVHLMYWDTGQKVGVNFIQPEKSNDIRKMLTKDIFREELAEVYKNKENIHKALMQKIKLCGTNAFELFDLSKSQPEVVDAPVRHLKAKEALVSAYKLADNLEKLGGLIREKYPNGALKYQYLHPELKAELDRITADIIGKTPDIAKLFEEFMATTKKQAMLYGGKENVTDYMENQKMTIYKNIGNKILQMTKQLQDRPLGGVLLDIQVADVSNDNAAIEYAPPCEEEYLIYDSISENNDFAASDGNNIDEYAGIEYAEPPPQAEQQFYETEDSNFSILGTAPSVPDIELSPPDYAGQSTKEHTIDWSERYKEARLMMFGDEKTPPDFEKALGLFLLEAESGNALAMHDLGRMYAYGLGTAADQQSSGEWYQKALSVFLTVEAENPKAYSEYRIGKMYFSGVGTDENLNEAIKYFELSAQLGNEYAQYQLAKIHLADDGADPLKKKEAVMWMTKSAAQGNQFAQYALGNVYLNGEDNNKEIARGIIYLRLSANQNNQFAQYKLGKIFLEGNDMPKNIDKAVKLLDAAAEQGNNYAQYTLGKLYFDGEEVPKNMDKANEYLKKALDGFVEQEKESHDDKLQYRIGQMYLAGMGAEISIEKAVEFFEKSAEQGNQFAQYSLGKLYLLGKEVPRQRELAFYWLNKSAEQGNIYARALMKNDKAYDVSLAISLLQDFMNILTSEKSKAVNTRRFKGHDLTKAEKAELAKKQNETSIEWGD